MNYYCIIPNYDASGPVTIAMEICKHMEAEGKKVYVHTLRRGVKTTHLGLSISSLRLRDILKMKGVVHSHTFRPDLVVALMAFFLGRRIKSITTIHSYFYDALRFEYPQWKLFISYLSWKRAIESFDEVVLISRAMERYYRFRKFKFKRTSVIYNWRSRLGDYQVRCKRKALKTNLLFCGSLDERKNIIKLIKEVKKRPGISLSIIGVGPENEFAKAVSANSANIRYFGFQSDISKFLIETDFLVLPSFAEGLPTVVLEAMQFGKPSLLSNIAVHREMCGLGAGVTFNHLDFSDFDKKLSQLSAFEKSEVRHAWTKYFSGARSAKLYSGLIYSDEKP